MEKFTENKKKILIALAAIFIVFFVVINRGRISHNREIEKEKVISIENVQDFHLTSKSILLWDNQTLYFCDKSGELLKKINKKEEDLEIFFTNNYAFIYDRDLRKLYEYSELGEHLNTIKVPADVYNIKYQNKNIIIHGKEKGTEYLYTLKVDGSLEEAYKSDNYIFDFDILEPKKNYAISEITTSATGYKSIFTYVLNGNKSSKDYMSEVGLYVNVKPSSAILITDKNLYRSTKEETIHKEIPNISDAIVDKNNLYLIHSGIISRYNKNLDEKEKYILAASGEKITKVSNSIYVYGKNDIGGEIGSKNEFYTRIGSSIEKVEINGLTIGALKEGRVTIYKVINSRGTNKNTLRDLSKEQDK